MCAGVCGTAARVSAAKQQMQQKQRRGGENKGVEDHFLPRELHRCSVCRKKGADFGPKVQNQYKGVRRLACGLKVCIHAGHGAKKRRTKTDVKGVGAKKCKPSIRGCDAALFQRLAFALHSSANDTLEDRHTKVGR